MKETLSKGKMGKQVGKWGSKVEPTSWPATTLVGAPQGGPHPSIPSRSLLGKYPKRHFSKNIPKSTFTIHDDVFQRLVELKIFVWA